MNKVFGSRHVILFCLLYLFQANLFGQSKTPARLQQIVDSLCLAGNFPGLSISIAYSDNSVSSFTSGYNDKEKKILLKTDDMLPQGSVGKTYVAAIAMQLIENSKMELDDKVSKYLGDQSWFARIPNANEITIRMLMNHTSGIMRYEFKDTFTADLTQNPDRVWSPEDLLAYVLDEKPPFAAGMGWDYSDTNYILLGLVIEHVTNTPYYDLLQKSILNKFGLNSTFPSVTRNVKGLAQGYAGDDNAFGKKDKVIDENGKFIVNPQFEWTGGGIHSTTSDLAKWGVILFGGSAISKNMLPIMLEGVPAKLGKDAKYGLGVIIRQTPFGISYGHSGFFPGYLTEMIYLPQHKICIAVQINTSDTKKLTFGPYRCAMEVARTLGLK